MRGSREFVWCRGVLTESWSVFKNTCEVLQYAQALSVLIWSTTLLTLLLIKSWSLCSSRWEFLLSILFCSALEILTVFTFTDSVRHLIVSSKDDGVLLRRRSLCSSLLQMLELQIVPEESAGVESKREKVWS